MPKTNKKDPVFYYSESKDKHIDIDTMSDVHIKRAFKKQIKQQEKSASDDAHFDHEENNVYVFYNNLFDFNMYINAKTKRMPCKSLINVGLLIEIIGRL